MVYATRFYDGLYGLNEYLPANIAMIDICLFIQTDRQFAPVRSINRSSFW